VEVPAVELMLNFDGETDSVGEADCVTVTYFEVTPVAETIMVAVRV